MPREEAPQLKNPDLYEKLRDQGSSKEKAARISNATAKKGTSSVGKKGGHSPKYEEWNVDDLKHRAKDLGLTGYSRKNKKDLIQSIRNH